MIRKLLYFVRSLFLNFSNSSKERSFTPISLFEKMTRSKTVLDGRIKYLFIVLFSVCANSVSAQCVNNLVTNGDFSNGATNWTFARALGDRVEINQENTYFSTTNNDNTAELDVQASLRQALTVVSGVSYTVSFLYARRPDPITPATIAVDFRVTYGTSSSITFPRITTNSTTPQVGTFTFTAPSNSIGIEFYNSLHGNSTFGAIIDNIVLVPTSQVTPIATTVPKGVFKTLTTCGVGSSAGLDVDNITDSSVTYSWNLPAGVTYTSSRTIKNPTVTFTSTGLKQFTVTATKGTCSSTSSIFINVADLPIAYNVTGTGSYCSGGSGLTVGLSNSASGVSYQLQKDGSNTGSAVTTSGGAINFGIQTAGTYTVVATNTSTGCTSNMSGSAVVTASTPPTVSITGTNNICVGNKTTLSSSGVGNWVSNNTAVASVNATTGEVTGVLAGIATFTFTNTAAPNCSAITGPVTVSSGAAAVFNASSTYTVPAGVTSLQVECWGGGGSGGAASGNSSAGGGGAGGSYVKNTSIPVNSNSIYTVTVGAGGAATTANGQPGESSWFGSTSTILAVGGNGGVVASTTSSNGTGGAVVVTGNIGGTVNTYGAGGSNGAIGGGTGGSGGAGGNGGVGGVGTTSNAAGNPGISPGGAGAGGRRSSGGTKSGGAGGAGRVIITIATPTASAGGSQTICQTGTALVGGATATNGTILWSHDGTGSLSNGTTLTPTYTAASGDAGKTVILTMTVSNGPCATAVAFYTVVVTPTVGTPTAITPSATTICQGSANTTYTTSATNATSYTWTVSGVGNSISGTGTTGTVTWAAGFSGQATIGVTANGCGTSSIVSTTVNVTPTVGAPVFTIGGASVRCQGISTDTYTASSTNATGITYALDLASRTGGNTINTSTGVVTYVAGWSGTSTITASAAGCNGPVTANHTVTITPTVGTPTAVTPSATTICQGSANTAYTTSATNATSYTWTVSGIGNTISGTGTTGTVTWAAGFSGQATIGVTANGCGTSSTVSTTVDVTPTVGTPTAITPSATTICQGSANTTYTTSATNATSYIWAVSGTGNTISGTGTTGTVTWSAGFSGQATISVKANGCGTSSIVSTTVNVNPLQSTPITGTLTQPTCASSSGGIIPLSNLPSTGTWTITQGGSFPGVTYSGTGSTYDVKNLAAGNYTFTVQGDANTCNSLASANVVLNTAAAKVWTGAVDGNWSNPANWNPVTATAPTASDCVVIPDVATVPNVPTIQGAGIIVDAYTLTVNDNASLTVNAKNTLKVVSTVTVGALGSLVFQNDASLVQTTNAANVGNITYHRDTEPVRRYDFTYWSTPITNIAQPYTLYKLSPATLLDKYSSYDSSINAWDINLNGTKEMIPGEGYTVRAPQTFSITNTAIYSATFTGTPNNGDYPVQIYNTNWSLIGNPYPSAIDALKFININHNASPSVDVGTLYFWTHNTPPSGTPSSNGTYDYTSNDYAAFNLSGSIGTGGAKLPNGSFGPPPTGEIAACQSFFMRASGSGIVKFTNDMRLDGKNDQFYKTSKSNTIEKNRVWLNLTNAKGAFKQALVGYIDGASDTWDVNYDAATMNGNSFIDFYSINESKKLAIQGRALPFQETDRVPLGYKTTVAGDFTIAIDHADGVFNNQAVYLEDKTTGTVTNLQAGNYTFTTAIGTFIDRFTIAYVKKTLGTGDFEDAQNGVFVSIKEKTIKVTSTKETIKEVTIYDINGQLLYNKKKVGLAELQIPNLQSSNQVLLVKVTLENDFTTTKKVIFQ